MGSDPQYIKYPDLTLAQDVFNISNPSCPETIRQNSLKKLQSAIEEFKMAPLYRHLAHPVEGILNSSGEGVPQHPTPAARNATKPLITSNMLANKKQPVKIDFPWDEKYYESLVEENNKELEALQKEEEEAAEAAGDTEVLAAQGKRAEFYARIGDKVRMRIVELLGRWFFVFDDILTCHALARTKQSQRTKLCSRRSVCWERRSIWCWR